MYERLVFYPTLLYNVLLEKFTYYKWFNRIDDTVILGALPFRSIIPQLQLQNVKGVVTLNEDYELQHFVPTSEEWEDAGMTQLKLPTPDLRAAPSQSDLDKGVAFILQHRHQGQSVYVHCKAGKTRSTTLVACYLINLHGWSVDETVQYIKSKRPHIWLRTTQFDALNLYKTRMRKKTG